MATIKSKNTKPEMLVRQTLHRAGYRYSLHCRDLPGTPDIVFRRLKKAIFVHGCFWHVHRCRFGRVVPATNTDFWSNKRRQNIERDVRHRAALPAEGWQVLVIWECETRQTQLLDVLMPFLDRSKRRQGKDKANASSRRR